MTMGYFPLHVVLFACVCTSCFRQRVVDCISVSSGNPCHLSANLLFILLHLYSQRKRAKTVAHMPTQSIVQDASHRIYSWHARPDTCFDFMI